MNSGLLSVLPSPELVRVTRYVEALRALFRRARTMTVAQERSHVLLREMAGDPAFVRGALEHHLRKPGALAIKNYPTVGLELDLNPYFSLQVNCWIPLPDRQADLSTKAIHHHGSLLLSTATVFGAGYEHWLFSRPALVDPVRALYRIEVTEKHRHPKGHVAFVPDEIPHLPFYPTDLSITVALWSNRARPSWRDYAKRLPLVKGREAALRRLVQRMGLSRALELNVVRYFDFFPVACGFEGIPDRREFPRGPNEDYLHSLFHVIQGTGCEALVPLVRQRLAADGAGVPNRDLVTTLLGDLESGRQIEGRLSRGHTGVPYANFTMGQIDAAEKGQVSSI